MSLADQYGAKSAVASWGYPIPPITVDELLDETNDRPARLVDMVRKCRAAVKESLGARGIVVKDATEKDAITVIDESTRTWLANNFPTISPEDGRWVRARIIDDLIGAGPIQPLRSDPRTTEIIVYSPRSISSKMPDGTRRASQGTSVEFSTPVAGRRGLRPAPGVLFDDDEHVLATVNWLAGKQPNSISPRVSATLDDGSRLQAILGDIAGGTTSLALRRHPKHAHTLCDLIEWGALPMEMAQDLAWFVQCRFTMVVSGATSSGKTSLLNALLPFVNPDHHMFIVEDTREIIHPSYLQVSRRVARLPRGDAEGVSMRDHIKDALRFRPDIICVGELRDAAALEAMKAYNTGHEGSATTCHANDAGNTIKRLAAMMTESPDMPSFELAKDLVASAVDIVVFIKRFPDGIRRVVEVVEVEKPPRNATGLLTEPRITPLWEYRPDEGFVRLSAPSADLFRVRGLQPSLDCPVSAEDIKATCEVMRTVAASPSEAD